MVVIGAWWGTGARAVDLEVGPKHTYDTVASALADANPKDRILVAPGTYTEDVFFGGGVDVEIAGAGAEEATGTTFLGAWTALNATVVVRDLILDANHGPSPALSLDGSTATLRDVEIRNSDYSGVFVGNASTLAAYDTAFRANASPFGGAGVYVTGDSEATLERATLEDNVAITSPGAGALAEGALTVRASFFLDNAAAIGAGIYCFTPSAVCRIEDSVFRGGIAETEGGGIGGSDADTIEVTRSMFCGNTASTLKDFPYYGGAVTVWRTANPVRLANNVFANNTCPGWKPPQTLYQTGAVHIGASGADVINNTFVGNGTDAVSGLFLFVYHPYDPAALALDVTNNLYANNGGNIAQSTISGLPSGGYNLFWGNAGDTDFGFGVDVYEDPLLSPPGSGCGVWQPVKGSAAIDAGDPDPALNDPDGTRSDIGATGGPEALVDADADGWAVPLDCDDDDPARAPFATEWCDGVDNDCDGEVDEDCEPSPEDTGTTDTDATDTTDATDATNLFGTPGDRSSASRTRLVGGGCACAGAGHGAGWQIGTAVFAWVLVWRRRGRPTTARSADR